MTSPEGVALLFQTHRAGERQLLRLPIHVALYVLCMVLAVSYTQAGSGPVR